MDVNELFDSIVEDEEFIQHYGVLGMKWGIRRAAGSYAKSQANRYGKPIERMAKTKAARSAAKGKKKAGPTVKNMSDEQLKKATQRLQLEKQYKTLSKKDTSKGAKFVKDVVIGGAKVGATAYVTAKTTEGIKYAMAQAAKKAS